MHNNYTEYKWENPETCAHSYIIPKIIRIIDDLNLSREVIILDAGCWGGSLVHTLYNDMGFDASRSGIELAKKSFPGLRENFFIHNVYEEKLPADVPQKYALIISTEVIEHLYSPRTYLRNVSLWLKKDGYLILTTPYHGYLKNVLVAMINKFDRHFEPLQEGGHIKFFSKNALYRLLQEVSFKPLKFYGSGRLPYLRKSMIVVAQKI